MLLSISRRARFQPACILVFGSLLCAGNLSAGVAPCTPDVHTLQLWHFDEAPIATSAANAVPGGVTLSVITNGALAGQTSLPGFGNAVSTYDGGPGATLSANPSGVPGRDAYVAPLPLTSGSGDDLLLNCTGPDGAFTFEALVYVDFSPTNLAVAPDSSRYMQIISADGDGSERIMQFRVLWSAVNDPTPELQFINIGSPIQTLSANLPTTGSNAIAQGEWFHVAASYNGQANTAGNFKLFWTRAETNRVQADSFASLRMTNGLPVLASDWVIGNEGRATGGSDGNWVGLIDEVRISDISRDPAGFIFFSDTDNDGLPDNWEIAHFGNLSQTDTGDPDEDTFSNMAEFLAGSSPVLKASTPADRDADGLPDDWESTWFGSLAYGPLDDTDNDGYTNAEERLAGTNPNSALSNPGDSDSDGLPDAWELLHFGNLAQSASGDPDQDGFTNLEEFQADSLPNNSQSFPARPRVAFIPLEDGDPSTSEFGFAGSSSINTVCFIQSGLKTVGDQQFVTWYGRHETDASYTYNNRLWVGRRSLSTNVWEVFRTMFTANNINDGHDTICFGIDGDGYMHLSWGMHGDAFHYTRSTNPVTGSLPIGFGPDTTMTGNENGVTYPQFFTLPDGDLLYLFREGGSGNGDTYLNRYSRVAQTWTNVHLDGSSQVPFIKGRGWVPNYNAYPNMPCLNEQGHMFLVWTWRYNSDSPAGEVGFQTNHDLDYARSIDGGLTWLRSDNTPYTLPISESGENGDPNTMAEKVISIPEGYSLINQAGMCLDESGQPVVATWWAPGSVTNNYRRQYMVAFPTATGWEARQISFRTNDPVNVKKPESEVRDLGRPVVVCDPEGRIIVLYRDNAGSNGLTIVHSLPKAIDPDRTVWTSFDLTTDNLGNYEPVMDLDRWQSASVLSILYQPSAGQGYTPPSNNAAQIGVLEWDAASYFAHRPNLLLSLSPNFQDAILSFASQPGWGYRVQTSTNLASWDTIATLDGNGKILQQVHTNALADSACFWRLQIQEGGFE